MGLDAAKALANTTWKLVSAEYRPLDSAGEEDATASPIEYLGPEPVGCLSYDGHNMSVQLSSSSRQPFASSDRAGGTPEEVSTAFRTYHAYFGTYTVEEYPPAVVHHIQGCSFPNWVGQDQRRFFSLDDAQRRLTLKTVPLSIRGQSVIGTLVWARAGTPAQ